jgi:hypothetical protein
MEDIKIKLDHTQIIQHITGTGSSFDFELSGNDIDLDKIVAKMLDQN